MNHYENQPSGFLPLSRATPPPIPTAPSPHTLLCSVKSSSHCFYPKRCAIRVGGDLDQRRVHSGVHQTRSPSTQKERRQPKNATQPPPSKRSPYPHLPCHSESQPHMFLVGCIPLPLSVCDTTRVMMNTVEYSSTATSKEQTSISSKREETKNTTTTTTTTTKTKQCLPTPRPPTLPTPPPHVPHTRPITLLIQLRTILHVSCASHTRPVTASGRTDRTPKERTMTK